ncbi:unnamed protein product [Symbiodinium sp. KB8]|nr:unnamed protein product [Symbiodinium sp. KB8]
MLQAVEYATADALSDLKAEVQQLASNAKKRDEFVKGQITKLEQLTSMLEKDSSYTLNQHQQKIQDQEESMNKLQSETTDLRQELNGEVSKVADLKTKADFLEERVTSRALSTWRRLGNSGAFVFFAYFLLAKELKKARQDLEKHALEAARKDAAGLDSSLRHQLLVRTRICETASEIGVGMEAAIQPIPTCSFPRIPIHGSKAEEVSTKAKKDLDGATSAVRGEMSKGQFLDFRNFRASAAQGVLEKCNTMVEESRQKQQALEQSLEKKIAQAEAASKQLTEEQVSLEKQARQHEEEVMHAELKKLDGEMKDNCQDRVLGNCIDRFVEELRQDAEESQQQLQQFRREAEDRSAAVLAENRANVELLQGESARLNAFCAGVSGLPTRQVEWRLPEDTLKQLEKVQDREPVDDPSLVGDAQASFFSPPFEAAGTRGMQLELRVHTRRSAPGDEEDASGNVCSLYLWACRGLQLVFRLFLGTESVVLRHSFDGKSPCGMKRMGSIIEQKSLDGSLKLGIEIHESLVESTTGSSSASDPMAAPADEPVESRGPVDGVLAVQRYVNHRLLELMQSQGKAFLDQLHKKVDVMRSRAVRRVQWRLENGPMLYQNFSKEQAVRSTAFQAAGVCGMQLVFYPQGCAGARPGFCSVFLSCPPNVTLRCWLWAGRLRKEARQEPAEQPELIGRVNFARFENVIDPVDESVELVLEIEEAQLASKTTMSSQPMPIEDGASRMDASEFSKQGPAIQSMSEPSKTDGRIERADVQRTKIQHTGGKPPPESVQQLPSIWTTQGFHSFGELEEGTSTRANTASTAKAASTNQSSPTPRLAGKPGPRKGGGRAPLSAREAKYKERTAQMPNTRWRG